ncbi:MAG: Cell division protein FtsQ [Legionellaceae bacterium]
MRLLTTHKCHAIRRGKSPQSFNSNTHRKIRNISLIILGLSLCLLAWCKLNDPKVMPVRQVKVKGNYSHVDKVAIQKTIMPFLKEGFVNIDSENLKKTLQLLPWVDKVKVMRVWPDKLEIQLMEHTPIAQWNEQELLDENGTLFHLNEQSLQHLPSLMGPEGQHNVVLHNYQKLNILLAPLGLRVARLYLSARQAWNMQLSNGVTVILGKVNPERRLKRLVNVYTQVAMAKEANIEYIDIRYSNGVAVKWKTNL